MSEIQSNQRKAIEALAAGSTVEMAALQAGVTAKTVYNWKSSHEGFIAELQSVTEGIMSESVNMLIGASRQAIITLTEIADDTEAPPGTRVSAARSILENTIRLSELWALEKRVSELEKRATDETARRPY